MRERLRQLRDYGFFRIMQMGGYFLRTKIFYRPATFIFFPIDIRGKKHIRIGRGMTCGTGCRFEVYAKDDTGEIVTIGKNVQINDYVHIAAIHRVSIGDNALLASRIFISDIQHDDYSGESGQSDPEIIVKERELSYRDVVIGDNVWIGEGAAVLPGVTIGHSSIIGANAVVTKDIPPLSIAVGNPARIIKMYNTTTHIWERV